MRSLLRRKDLCLFLFSLLASAGFLLICTKSSPLYPMNDWVDVNCFFTVGKSMLHGIVPYAELYEQKGPVLYFLYAIAALISDRSFFGVYLLETVTFGLFLYFCGKLARIYLGESFMVYVTVLILAAIIPISPAFAHGGGAEELCLFMLAYGLYSVIAALHDGRWLTFREAFLNGVFAAMVLYIKFTILGFYFGLALFVVIWYLCKHFSWKPLLVTIGQFLLGVAAVSAVVFGYFLICGAVRDFFTVYFYNNLFLYPQETEGTKLELIQKCLESTLAHNSSYAPFLWLGVALFATDIRQNMKDLSVAFLCFAGLSIGTYWGGRGYTYYGLILSVFAVFGVIAIFRLIQLLRIPRLIGKYCEPRPLICAIVLCILTAALLSNSYKKSQNVYLMSYEKEDLPAYRFAEIINQTEDPTLLNLGFLDGGFYYAADVLPSCEFFCTLNIDAPGMWDTQRQWVENGEVDFVVTRKFTLDQYTRSSTLYSLVDEATFYFEGVDFTYYLYQKNPV